MNNHSKSIGAVSRDLGVRLRKNRMTIAVAESCTGGMIGAAITMAPGASEYFLGGVIAYDDRIKRDVLEVPAGTLNRYGAVSGQTVIAMAKGVRKLFKTDCAVAVSGVAGPGGGTKEKPVGLVHIGIAAGNMAWSIECRFTGSRNAIRAKTASKALESVAIAVNGSKQ